MTTQTIDTPTELDSPATPTEIAVVELLTENTGTHILDSGGAYGRNWERNQGKAVADYRAEPAARLDYAEYVTLSLFHWLVARLDYDPHADRVFRLWTELDDPEHDTPWLVSAERFAARVVTGDPDNDRWASYPGQYLSGVTNSYNHEDALSQTIQFVVYTDPRDDETYVLLQVHGGCDVRGGYTAPKVFRTNGYDGASDMFDLDCFTLACTREDQHGIPALDSMPNPADHWLDYRVGEFTDAEGDCFERYDKQGDLWARRGLEDWIHVPTGDDGEPDRDAAFIQCPWCSTPDAHVPMTVHDYPVG